MLAAVEKLLRQGLAHFSAGQFTEAGRLFRQALQDDPDNPDALHLLGLVVGKFGETDEAIRLILQAISRNPGAAVFHLNLGNAFKATGRFPEALGSYGQALSLNPGFAEAHANLGDVLAGIGNFTEATTSYRRAIELKPDFANAHNNLGNLFARTGESQLALDCYRSAVRHDPGYADALSNLGYELTNLNDLATAADMCRKAVAANPAHLAAHCNLARVLFLKGEFEEAEGIATECLRLDPSVFEANLILGHIFVSTGRRDAATASYRAACELSPDSTEAYMALGNLLAIEGQLDADQGVLRKVLISVTDGTKLWVPHLLDILTPYVLLEQGDWFEDEIEFVRGLLRPGEHVVDIGANYGCYTLAMSKSVGPGGKVWAYEPASLTAHFLNKSIAENEASNVEVFREAVSDQVGSIEFHVSMAPELSGLGQREDSFLKEEVKVTTLDSCAEQFGWDEIAFIKIDAEGHESQVLSGARSLLETTSPLVMYEVSHMERMNRGLIAEFAELGYQSYRLIPGLGALAPIDDAILNDMSILNLFCCKPDRAANLAARNLLTDASAPLPGLPDDAWSGYLETKVYCDAQRDLISNVDSTGGADWPAHRDAIGYYGLSKSEKLSPAERYACLLKCMTILNPITRPDELAAIARVSLLARVASDLGQRHAAASLLLSAVGWLKSGAGVTIAEPMVPAAERFDNIDPAGQLGAWVSATIIEHCLSVADRSSLQSAPSKLEYYDILRTNPFASCESTRRRVLFRNRLGLPPDTQSGDLIYNLAADNLNTEFWKSNFPPVR